MATFTYTSVGNLDDWSDVLTNISPTKTPMFSMFRKGSTDAMTHNWLNDTIRQPAENKHLEDAALLAVPASPRVRLQNNIQIFQSGYYVTDSQQAVRKAAITDELGYQMEKCLKEISLDVEFAFVKNATTSLSATSTEGMLGGVPYFNNINIVDGAGGALTEVMFNDAMEKAWEKGGEPDLVFCNGKNKRIISGFTANTTKNRDQTEEKLKTVINVYESDFGIVEIKAHRLYDSTRVDFLQRDMFSTMYLIPFRQEKLVRTRLTKDRNINGQLTMECRAKEAHSAITGLAA